MIEHLPTMHQTPGVSPNTAEGVLLKVKHKIYNSDSSSVRSITAYQWNLNQGAILSECQFSFLKREIPLN